MMKLINTTNSHLKLVHQQLENTDAVLVEVYSAGNTDVIYTHADTHDELIISNRYRTIRQDEIDFIRHYFLKRKIDKQRLKVSGIQTSATDKLIEISFPLC